MKIKKHILLAACVCLTLIGNSQNRISHNGQDIFLNGMNLAWLNFSGDVSSLDIATFSKALDSISNGGGNALRWWLHTNGTSSPRFINDSVRDITPTQIANMKKALDSAYVRGVGIVMCLWSFDMLKSDLSASVLNRNKLMLNDTIYTKAYINNALIPMLNAIGSHPAVICWEVFNEPEGMWNNSFTNWTDVDDAPEASIQQFINRVAGAVHRHAPGAKVSNGSWAFRASCDVNGNYNYYRDDRLIAAGGDSLGTLDFYMVHYYDWAGDNGPFSHPASYWALDKPLVIGEFSADGPKAGVSPQAAYNYLYDNGYAGGLSWTWTGHDGNGNVKDATEGMLDLYTKHPGDIVIDYPTVDVNYIPTIVTPIPDTSFPKGAATLNNFLDLKDYFYDAEDGTGLIYTIDKNSNPALVTPGLTAEGILSLSINDVEGLSKITIHATDKGKRFGSISFYVATYATDHDNKAVHKTAFASSSYRPAYPAAYAVDSNSATSWISGNSNNEWIAVKFDKQYTIEGIKLVWGPVYAIKYDIQVSDNGTDWTTVYSQEKGKAGTQIFEIEPTTTNYLRMNGRLKSASTSSYTLNEFEAYEYGFVSGISSFEYNDQSISIYPIPANDFINIQSLTDLQITNINILNNSGQLIKNESVNKLNNTFDISDLLPGDYFMFIYTNNKVVLKKFIKE